MRWCILRPMADLTPLTGELQTQVMSALWRLGGGTVEQVRSALPPRYRGAYNTIQTVLNRLAERGLLSRIKSGNAIEYRPVFSEAEYLSRSISQTLAAASMDARQAALARLIGGLGKGELEDLQRLAKEMGKPRRRR
jgi:predicted transcriptional regulator